MLHAQDTGVVAGTVTEAESGNPVFGITVAVEGSATAAVTDEQGRYRILALDPGRYTLRFGWLGFASQELDVVIAAGETQTLDVVLEQDPIILGEIRVSSVSRQPERVVDAPAALSVPEPARVRDLAATGQTPLLVADLTGVRAPQSGVYDFNLNARGFNSTLNRRLLVLVDGRDVSVPLLNNQDWPDLSVLDDATRVELIRGPGSALYGANAFTGVLNIVTPSVREAQGTQLRVGGGELSTARADGRYAVVSRDLRWGFGVSGGWARSDSWDRSRTNVGDLEREYSDALGSSSTVTAPAPGYDLAPLAGQTKQGPFGLPGEALGTPDPVTGYFGSARLDYYLEDGGVITAEGGHSRWENYVVTTTLGRSQITEVKRPWARLAWADDDFSVMAYYTGRTGDAISLSTATPGPSDGYTFHGEGQFNRGFADDRGRLVLGGSARTTNVNTEGTVLAPLEDDRSDEYFSAYGQLEFELHPKVRLVFAGRVDDGNLLDAEFSPKLGITVSPSQDQTLRLTMNRAFLTPSVLQRFLRFPAGPPLDFSALEEGLRQSPLGPLLAGVPQGTLFTTSSAVPLLVIGNRSLKPERVTGVEVGYKGQVGQWFLTADAFYSEIVDFATGALPGANPAFRGWTAPEAVPADFRGTLETAVIDVVGSGLTRLEDGSTALVLSLGNAGRAEEWGIELGAGLQVTDEVRVDGNYTYYDFTLDKQAFLPGDSVRANTPSHSGNLAVAYQNRSGLRVRAGLRLVGEFDYLGGLYGGVVPSSQSLDINVGYRLTDELRADVVGTNLFDQRRFHVYGGSLVGRRILASLTWEP